MGFTVQNVRLVDFRNYESAEFELGDRLTVIGGPNATGKTSIVEALQLTTAGQSFRNPQWKETIRWGAEQAAVSMVASGGGRTLQTNMVVDPKGRRAYSVNGNKVKRVADVRGHLPGVVFTPDDLLVVKGSAERRRGLLDTLGDQLSHTYETLRREYDRVLKQRNAALKEGNTEVVDAVTESLVKTGAKYATHRKRLLHRVSPHATRIYQEIADGESLSVTYEQTWVAREEVSESEIEEEFMRALERARDEETRRGTTTVGPHRDDITFLVSGRNARAYASQGQQRATALAWKLAEVQVVRDVTGSNPLLLLDDVMSELDEARRESLVGLVDKEAQTVVTTTNLHYFSSATLGAAHVLELER